MRTLLLWLKAQRSDWQAGIPPGVLASASAARAPYRSPEPPVDADVHQPTSSSRGCDPQIHLLTCNLRRTIIGSGNWEFNVLA